MLVVLLWVAGVDQDIIKVNNANIIKKVSKNLINERLKSRWRIRQPKRHNPIFIMTITGTESSLPFIASPDPYPVVSVSKI
jgi:hypothetical protein